MLNTLRISFSLKNTYRVNSILYSIRQIPLVKHLLPATIYQVKGFKIFANVLSVLWEFVTIFLFKFLYFFLMVLVPGDLHPMVPARESFLHILLFLTLVGSYMHTNLFAPSRDKYYAMILLRMNAQSYTLVHFGYDLAKTVVGFLPCMLLWGQMQGVPLWLCLLIPFCVAGAKLAVSAYSLRDYEKHGYVRNDTKFQKSAWILTFVLLALAYFPPTMGIVLPLQLSAALFLLCLPAGIWGLREMVRFPYYREINKELLSQVTNQMDTVKKAAKTASEKTISTDGSITSRKQGFEYLNELFIKRHRKILWRSTLRIAAVCGAGKPEPGFLHILGIKTAAGVKQLAQVQHGRHVPGIGRLLRQGNVLIHPSGSFRHIAGHLIMHDQLFGRICVSVHGFLPEPGQIGVKISFSRGNRRRRDRRCLKRRLCQAQRA